MVKEPTPRVRELRALLQVVHLGVRGLTVELLAGLQVLKSMVAFTKRLSLKKSCSPSLQQSQVACIHYSKSTKFMILHSSR
jgi:hypothetical protein